MTRREIRRKAAKLYRDGQNMPAIAAELGVSVTTVCRWLRLERVDVRDPHGEALKDLVRLLRRRPMTAREIAEEMQCSKPVAYSRLRALTKTGVVLYQLQAKVSEFGPTAIAYGIR